MKNILHWLRQHPKVLRLVGVLFWVFLLVLSIFADSEDWFRASKRRESSTETETTTCIPKQPTAKKETTLPESKFSYVPIETGKTWRELIEERLEEIFQQEFETIPANYPNNRRIWLPSGGHIETEGSGSTLPDVWYSSKTIESPTEYQGLLTITKMNGVSTLKGISPFLGMKTVSQLNDLIDEAVKELTNAPAFTVMKSVSGKIGSVDIEVTAYSTNFLFLDHIDIKFTP